MSHFLCPNCGQQELSPGGEDHFLCLECFSEFVIRALPMPPLRRKAVQHYQADMLEEFKRAEEMDELRYWKGGSL